MIEHHRNPSLMLSEPNPCYSFSELAFPDPVKGESGRDPTEGF